MTPTPGTRPVSSVGLATNWRLSTVGNQTHPDSSYAHQKFLYGRLSICFSLCIFHSCIFHSRIFSAPVGTPHEISTYLENIDFAFFYKFLNKRSQNQNVNIRTGNISRAVISVFGSGILCYLNDCRTKLHMRSSCAKPDRGVC